MNFVKSTLASAALLAAASANATPINGDSLQNIINGLYSSGCQGCAPVSDAPNVQTSQTEQDQVWMIEASGASVATIVLELAGFADQNILGVYDIDNPTHSVQLFGGSASSGSTVFFGFDDTGMSYLNNTATGVTFGANRFGYYLQTPNNIFYSQSFLNPGGSDQLVSFQGDGDLIKLPKKFPGLWGSSSYILGWEDLPYNGSDKDFDDFVVYVESVTPVPEPGTLALFGIGLLALGVGGLRKRRSVASR